jgi:hypothetical protein
MGAGKQWASKGYQALGIGYSLQAGEGLWMLWLLLKDL